MARFCKSDKLLINHRELKYICLFYIILLFCFFLWCIFKKYHENRINRKHKRKGSDSSHKNEKTEFFNYIYESYNDNDDVIIRQEGYKNSLCGFLLKNISIVLYLLTHFIIILLIGNEYCIKENGEILWNDRAFVFFIFLLLCFIITYGILIVRKHMHSFFIKPSLLKDSDYVLVYTKNEDYTNSYKNIFKESYVYITNVFIKWNKKIYKYSCKYIKLLHYYQMNAKSFFFFISTDKKKKKNDYIKNSYHDDDLDDDDIQNKDNNNYYYSNIYKKNSYYNNSFHKKSISNQYSNKRLSRNSLYTKKVLRDQENNLGYYDQDQNEVAHIYNLHNRLKKNNKIKEYA